MVVCGIRLLIQSLLYAMPELSAPLTVLYLRHGSYWIPYALSLQTLSIMTELLIQLCMLPSPGNLSCHASPRFLLPSGSQVTSLFQHSLDCESGCSARGSSSSVSPAPARSSLSPPGSSSLVKSEPVKATTVCCSEGPPATLLIYTANPLGFSFIPPALWNPCSILMPSYSEIPLSHSLFGCLSQFTCIIIEFFFFNRLLHIFTSKF